MAIAAQPWADTLVDAGSGTARTWNGLARLPGTAEAAASTGGRHGGRMPEHRFHALPAPVGAAGGRGFEHRSRIGIGPADGSGGGRDVHEGWSGLPAVHRRARSVRYLRRSLSAVSGSARNDDPAAVTAAGAVCPERPHRSAGV